MSAPFPQRVVPFYGDELIAVQQEDGLIFVLFNRLCENLGLKRWSQVQRVQRHTVMNDGLVTLPVETEGGAQQVQCLRIDLLPLWLSGVQATRVKDELQEKLIRYQKEAAQVLWQAFKPQIIVSDATPVTVDDQVIIQLQQVADMGQAITRLANEQIELYRQQQHLAQRMDKAAQVIKDVQVRLTLLEEQVHPAAYITEEQANGVKLAVQSLGELLASRGGESYQAIYRELYSRFGVSSYKLIRLEQYQGVLSFLEKWRAAGSKP
jgi:hypothetical protein